jgi:hypothetical protein
MPALGRFIMDIARIVARNAFNQAPNHQILSKFQSPSPKDVLEVKRLLLKTCKIPIEIVDVIIDYAEYWPRTTVTNGRKNFRVGGADSDTFIVSVNLLGA